MLRAVRFGAGVVSDCALVVVLSVVWAYFHHTGLWCTGVARPNDAWSRTAGDSEAQRLLSLRELDTAAAGAALALLQSNGAVRAGDAVSPSGVLAGVLHATNQVSAFRYDAQRTGLAPAHTTVGRLPTSEVAPGTSGKGHYALQWKTAPLNAREYYASKSSPAVSTRHVYVGTDRGTLVALDRHTGKQVWEYVTTGAPAASGVRNPKGIHGTAAFDAVADRTRDTALAYIGDYNGWLYAVERHNGSQHWRAKLGGSLGSSSVLYEGLLLVGVELNVPNRTNGDGFLQVMDARRGARVWRSDSIGGHPHATPTIDPHTHCVFLGGNGGRIACWDISALLCNRTHTRAANLMSPHALSTACSASGGKTGAEDVKQLWVFRTGQHPVPKGWPAHAVSPAMYPDAEIKSTAALHPRADAHLLYVSAWDFCVYALDSRTGVEVWHFRAQDRIMSSPSVDPLRELVVVGSHDRRVYGLDARTGALRWAVPTGERVLSSATIVLADGVAIIGSGDSVVYVIDLDTGAVTSRLFVDDMVTSQPVAVGRELFVTDFSGAVYAYRAIGGGFGITGAQDVSDAFGPALTLAERRRMGDELVDDDERPVGAEEEDDDDEEDDEDDEDDD